MKHLERGTKILLVCQSNLKYSVKNIVWVIQALDSKAYDRYRDSKFYITLVLICYNFYQKELCDW